jgi:C4-dicarboxylate-specific signal transduction histidine kinase
VPDELTQVVMNIINNAKDALISNANNSNPWIDIQINEVNESVIISIEDNGGGIPSQILPKIFDPYFTTKHKSQGTGLGLSMSYKIITESIGGKLYVKNSENGAKFFIEIPI